MAETKARHIANLVEDDGDVKSAHLDNITVTPTAVSDQANTSTGYLDLPSGTTAQRPVSAAVGQLRYNTTLNQLEFYNGTGWVSTNEMIPAITSISGNIFATVTSNLTITGTDFNTQVGVSIQWLEGNTVLVTETGITPTNTTTITRAVPSQVYGQTAGDTITIKVINAGTTASNGVTKTVLALPSGGTKTTSGSYHIHTFTSSGTFANTISNLSTEYLVIGGGGAGGGGHYNGGGGGAGGYRTNVSGQSSGGGASAEGAMTLSATNYSVVIGAGQPGKVESDQPSQASDSSFNNITAEGGGGGGKHNTHQGGFDGGSGGGASQASSSKGDDSGAGTANQGYDGGAGWYAAGAGGGGAGQRGALGTNYTGPYSGGTTGVKGGDGVSSNITGTATTRAGGGGGGGRDSHSVPVGVGGSGGGGNGGATTGGNGNNGSANTGSGGGGVGGSTATNRTSGAGGSGIVIIRYQLP